MIQLTAQTSQLQARLEEKQRQRVTLQYQVQDLALQDHTHLQPAASALLPPPPYPGAEHADDPLPDFRNLSLEDADWFHEGIPRYRCSYPIWCQSEAGSMSHIIMLKPRYNAGPGDMI